jgi:hypothetical protein
MVTASFENFGIPFQFPIEMDETRADLESKVGAPGTRHGHGHIPAVPPFADMAKDGFVGFLLLLIHCNKGQASEGHVLDGVPTTRWHRLG